MTPNRGAGAQAPALPVPKGPAFEIHAVVYDHEHKRNVRIVGIIRHERIEFTCFAFHSGAHRKDCKRSTVTWFQYCVTPDIRMGRHNNNRRYYHQAERHITDAY